MVFYILTSVVFISELIIAISLICLLIKLDKVVLQYDKLIDEFKPKIKEIFSLFHKLSEQLLELAPYYVEEIKMCFLKLLLNNFKGIIAGWTLYSLKKKFNIKFSFGLKIIKLFKTVIEYI